MEYQPGTVMPPLDSEIEQILVHLVERSLTVDRARRRFFVIEVDQLPGSIVSGGGVEGQYEVADQDLRELENYGLIEVQGQKLSGSYECFITQHGYHYAQEVKQRGEPLEKTEETVQTYIASSDFRARYPGAYAKWREAASNLASDPIENTTRIGHDCREALQSFSAALLDRHGLEDPGGGSFEAIRAVLNRHKGALGNRTHALLEVLYDLWRAVSGLAQRQEHGQKKDEPLDLDDARRCVWYTGLVMYEFERTLPSP